MPFQFNFGGFNQNPNGTGPDFSQFHQQKRPQKPRKAIGNAFTRTLINVIVTVVVGLIYFYVQLPALNFHDDSFYAFLFLLAIIYTGCALLTSGFQGTGAKGYFNFVKKQCKIPFIIVILLAATIAVGSLSSWVLFRAGAYSKLLPIEPGNFAEEVEEISFDQIPMLDDDSAMRLGSRKLGELADMVSQFEVADDYTQINVGGRPVRVTPLRYGDIIKWFNNRGDGLPAYLIVDMVTQKVDVVRLDEGMKYTTAEHFSRNLYRHIRFHYPTYMFDAPTFEIDDEGTPYWICSRIVKTIGLFGGTDVKGAVLVNAITGESEYYEEVPQWVDRVYSADLITEQYDYYGEYHNGFFNSIFGQKDVTITTRGYNYLAMNDDVYVYTGVTSVTSDASNIGFLLNNQRTKETKFYPSAGAEEFSAMSSAQGQVQQMKYRATFPLLLNISDQPTYFMALKDDAGLVKMYAMVNVQQYQIVATGTTVADCEKNYRVMLNHNNLIDDADVDVIPSDENMVSGTITEIRSAVLDGNTYYFIQLDGSDLFYALSAAQNPLAVILNTGDDVDIRYQDGVMQGILTGSIVTRSGEKAPVEPLELEPTKPALEPDVEQPVA